MKDTSKTDKAIALILMGVFAYVLARVLRVDFTFDEIWTIDDYVSKSFLKIIFDPSDANNHILNTMLVKLSFGIFGHSIFAARLPNLVAFGVYLLFTWRISRTLASIPLKILLFSLLCFNPFVLDFFGLARGYGLAMCFELGALYSLVAYTRSDERRMMRWGAWLSLLASCSNFSFLPFTLAYGAVAVLLCCYRSGYRHRETLGLAGCYVAGAILLFIPLDRLRHQGSLYYGGYDGLYKDVLGTLISVSAGGHIPDASLHWWQAGMALLIASLVPAVILRRRVPMAIYMPALLMTAILVITGCTIYAQHVIFHTPYPIDRTALCFIAMISLTLVYGLASVSYERWWVGVIPATGLSLVVIAGFVINANLYKTIFWNFESHTTEILDHIEARAAAQNKHYVIDYSWPLRKSVQYYLAHGRYDHINEAIQADHRDTICEHSDCYIYMTRAMPEVGYHLHDDRMKQLFPIIEMDRWRDNILLLAPAKSP